jgi:hypothetical protein
MKGQLSIYTGNHDFAPGIADIIDMLIYSFRKRGWSVSTSETLRSECVNFVVDEFSDAEKRQAIKAFRQANPHTTLVLVATEFISKKWGVQSFNLFGVGEWCNVVLLNLTLSRTGNRSGANPLTSAIVAIPALLIVVLWCLLNPVATIRRIRDKTVLGMCLSMINNRAYMHKRYLGFRDSLFLFDAVIVTHPCIATHINGREQPSPRPIHLGFLNPEIDGSASLSATNQEMRPGFEMTGTITSHRKKELNSLNRFLDFARLSDKAPQPCASIGFHETVEAKRSALSFHPPQTRKWPHSSPTRLYRSIAKNGSIPVLTRRFSECEIENICLVFEQSPKFLQTINQLAFKADERADYLREKIAAYNESVRGFNDEISTKLHKLTQHDKIRFN